MHVVGTNFRQSHTLSLHHCRVPPFNILHYKSWHHELSFYHKHALPADYNQQMFAKYFIGKALAKALKHWSRLCQRLTLSTARRPAAKDWKILQQGLLEPFAVHLGAGFRNQHCSDVWWFWTRQASSMFMTYMKAN